MPKMPLGDPKSFVGSVSASEELLSFGLKLTDVPGVPGHRAGISFRAAYGAFLIDVDDNSYVDLCNQMGSVVLGHRDPDVTAAVEEAVALSLPAAADHRLIARVSSAIASACGGAVNVAYFHNGSTAVRAACAAARRATQKPFIVSAGYHGWDPMWQSPDSPFRPNCDGVFDCLYLLPELEAFLAVEHSKVAAAVISPDYVHIQTETIDAMLSICRSYGIPVISDEVKNGFRFGYGPSLIRFGLKADAYVFSKGLANGWPLACIAGPDWLIQETLFFRSTLTFHVPSFAAAEATLTKMSRCAVQAEIARNAGIFLDAVREILKACGLPIEAEGRAALFQFVFGNQDLEEEFYAQATREGLILFAGDNQTPSFAFQGEACAEAASALERTVWHLGKRFSDLRGQPISAERRWRAAMMQMDGFPDTPVDPGVRRKLISAAFNSGVKE